MSLVDENEWSEDLELENALLELSMAEDTTNNNDVDDTANKATVGTSPSIANILGKINHENNDESTILQATQEIETFLSCNGDIAASMTSPLQQEFYDANGVNVIFTLLRTIGEANLLIRKQCLSILRLSARFEANRAIMMDSIDFINHILHCLRDVRDSECQGFAANCIRNIALTSNYHINMVQSFEILESIIDMLQYWVLHLSENPTMEEPAALVTAFGALYVLTFNNMTNQHHLITKRTGTLSFFMTLLQTSNNSALLELLLSLLCSMSSMCNQLNSTSMVEYEKLSQFTCDFEAAGGLNVCKTLFTKCGLTTKRRICEVFYGTMDLLFEKMLNNEVNMLDFFIQHALSSTTFIGGDDNADEVSLRILLLSLASNLASKQKSEDYALIAYRADCQHQTVTFLINYLRSLNDLSGNRYPSWTFGVLEVLNMLILYSSFNHDAAQEADVFAVLSKILEVPSKHNDNSILIASYSIIWAMSKTTQSQSAIYDTGLLMKVLDTFASNESDLNLDEICIGILSFLALYRPSKELLLQNDFLKILTEKLAKCSMQMIQRNEDLLTVFTNFVDNSSEDCKLAFLQEENGLNSIILRFKICANHVLKFLLRIATHADVASYLIKQRSVLEMMVTLLTDFNNSTTVDNTYKLLNLISYFAGDEEIAFLHELQLVEKLNALLESNHEASVKDVAISVIDWINAQSPDGLDPDLLDALLLAGAI